MSGQSVVTVVEATVSDHDRLLVLARRSPYTRDFGNQIFSGDVVYEKGWIGKAVSPNLGLIAGFVCVRHGVRNTWTSLYFMGVRQAFHRQGVGRALVEWALETSPHGKVRLLCDNDNVGARAFYDRLGFEPYDEIAHGTRLEITELRL